MLHILGDLRARLAALSLGVLLLGPALTAQDVRAAGTLELELASGAGCQAEWLPTFGQQPGAPGGVYAMQVFDSGDGPELWASSKGGGIGAINGNLGRWNGSGWKMHVAKRVRAFAVLDDGSDSRLFMGGEFQGVDIGVDFTPAKYIAQWDGTSWSTLGPGMSGWVKALAVFDDGNGPVLYAGGLFEPTVDQPGKYIARWDGTSWTSVANTINAPVESLAVFDDGTGPALYAGGWFTEIDGVLAKRVARWDGSSWSALGSGLGTSSAFTEYTAALATFDDGSGPALYAGGTFSSTSVSYVARWDGASWSSLGSGVDGPVRALATLDDGTGPALFVGGVFSSAGGQVAQHIARWSGTSWSGVGGGLSQGYFGLGVLAITSYDDGNGPRIHVGGFFNDAGGVPGTKNLCTWDGTSYGALGTGLTGPVRACVSHDDGSGPALYVAGDFTAAGELPLAHIGRWDGSVWSDVGGGLNGDVWALHVHDDGGGPALYAGGDFSSAGGVPASRIAKWDGSAWSALGAGISCPDFNPHGCVRALASFDDSEGPTLVAGGDFLSAGPSPANGIARWKEGSWRALEGTTGSKVIHALAVFDDGGGPDLYVGGNFSQLGGQEGPVVRWDGASWSGLGFGADSFLVRALTVWDDGTGAALFAAGCSGIEKWDGARWSADDASLPNARALLGYEDASGSYLVADDEWWDGSSWSQMGIGTDLPVLALATHDAGSGRDLYVGGSFLLADDSSFYPTSEGDSFLARWGGCSPSPSPWVDLGGGTSGVAGVPNLTLSGPLTPLSRLTLDLVDGPPSALALLFVSFTSNPVAYVGGTLHTFPFDELLVLATDPTGGLSGSTVLPSGIPFGQELWFQLALDDSVPIFDTSLSNGVRGTVP